MRKVLADSVATGLKRPRIGSEHVPLLILTLAPGAARILLTWLTLALIVVP